jgi:hypothetical protein
MSLPPNSAGESAVLGPRTQLASGRLDTKGKICPLPEAKAGTAAQLAHLRAV